MLKRSNLKWLLILGLAVLLVPAAHADSIFPLTEDGCAGGCGTNPFGQVDLAQSGNSVLVTVTLFNGDQFFKSGAGYALEFNITGNQAITDSNLTPGFEQTGSATNTFGSFMDTVWCVAACPLSDGHLNPGPLSFLVSLTDGGTLSVDDFITNSDGNYFSLNILGNNGTSTGIVAANDPVPTPEPGSMLLLGMGLAAVAGFRRKRLPA